MSQYVDPQIINAEDATHHSRLDVIDQLDITGLTGASLFHHDSPYDACSPQFNRGTRTAPVRAFDRSVDPVTKALLETHQQRESSVGNEDDSREHFHELSELSAHQDGAELVNDYVQPTTAQGELMGTTAEPWQEFHNTSPYRRDVATRSASKEPQFDDMEAILLGGRRRTPTTDARRDASPHPTDELEGSNRLASKESGAGLGRSKSLLGRFRRLKVNPEQAARADDAAQPPAPHALTRSQTSQAPQAAAPLYSSKVPTTYALPMNTAGASAGQMGPSMSLHQPESAYTLSGNDAPRSSLPLPPPLPPKERGMDVAAAPVSRPSQSDRGAAYAQPASSEPPSRGMGLWRRLTLPRRRDVSQ
ncbi:hypothetical protein MNAN1_001710 [Malassezia nana]|uniref:Uncharacterized protein n=1 Tax=Malassezia nana TaxID=180528 RepID=A0AAF0J771_9BASI|nr:hypothetical protein MNAN1_001710 [Malassezia nana]